MKVVILGAGRIGGSLVKYLSEEACDITVVDENAKVIEQLTDHYDINGICGNAASHRILEMAGMENTDVVIAASSNDETNVMACMLAKNMGASYTIARVRSKDFLEDLDYIRKQMKIDMLINPEYKTAEEIARLLQMPTAVHVQEFLEGSVQIAELTLGENHPMADHSLRELRPLLDVNMLITTVQRQKKIIVPAGDFELKSGDIICVLAQKDQMQKLLEKLTLVHRPVKKVTMVGCGTIGYYLAHLLKDSKMKLTIIEFSKERCFKLHQQFPNASIVYGDAVDQTILSEEGLAKSDACVSLTGADDVNLVTSMFAWSQGIPKIITKIVNTGYAEVLKGVAIDNTVSPHLISANEILQCIRSFDPQGYKAQIQKLYRIAENKAEILELSAEGFPYYDVPLKEPSMNLKEGILVAAIIRDSSVIIPNGNSVIKKDDHVLVITTTNHKINHLSHILRA